MATKKGTQRQQNFLTRYMRETQGELKKVVWPTRREAWNLTIITGVVILAMAVILGGFDAIFSELLKLMLGI